MTDQDHPRLARPLTIPYTIVTMLATDLHAGPAGLVLVFAPSVSRATRLVEEIERLSGTLEVQVICDLASLRTHLATVRPDVVLTDVTDVDTGAILELVAAGAVRGPTIAIDGAATAARRAAALDAGAAAYLDGSSDVPPAAAQMVSVVQRASAAGLRADETRRHLHDILEASSDGIFVLVDGVFYYLNDAFACALGRPPETLVGRRALVELVPERHRAHTREDLGRSEIGGGVRELVELVLESATGRELRFEVALRASVVDGQRALVGIARDVTATRELQQEIERARQRMAQVERLRALGELAAGVAHDFNNTIGTILGRVRLAQHKVARAEPVADDLGVIELAARNAAAVVRRIHEFSRPTSHDTWVELDLGAVVDDAVALVRAQVPEGVALRLERLDTPRVHGNPAELREVLLNLLRNALDAVAERGTVVARCHGDDEKAVVEIEDDGPGMSEAVRLRLFEPFFTTKGDNGTGLGLSVSRWILRRHDAHVDVRSGPGEGTCFRITFRPPSWIGRRVTAAPRHGLRILVVDDDDAVAEVIQDLLSERGHEVLVVHDPIEAAQLLGEHSIDLLISDLDLPGMSGWQLARKVRELQPQIVVGLVTGWPLGASEQEVRARGVDFVLNKPFSAEALHDAVTACRGGAPSEWG